MSYIYTEVTTCFNLEFRKKSLRSCFLPERYKKVSKRQTIMREKKEDLYTFLKLIGGDGRKEKGLIFTLSHFKHCPQPLLFPCS